MNAETKGRLVVIEDFRPQGSLARHIALVAEDDAQQFRLDAVATTGYAFDLDAIRLANSKDDARRLVACWNACDGISTEGLEKIRKPLLEAMLDERDKLRAQLVAAMEGEQDARAMERAVIAERAKLLETVRQMREALRVAADAGPPHVKHERIVGAIKLADGVLK